MRFYCEDWCFKQILRNFQISWCILGGCNHFSRNETHVAVLFFLVCHFQPLDFLAELRPHKPFCFEEIKHVWPSRYVKCVKCDVKVVCEQWWNHFPLQLILTEHKVIMLMKENCWGLRTLNSESHSCYGENTIQLDFHTQEGNYTLI